MELHEEQHQRCSNSNSGGGSCSVAGAGAGGGNRSCKKPKQKKIPQRGPGVAQLEKIRLEGQQKNAATTAAAASSNSSFLPMWNSFEVIPHNEKLDFPNPLQNNSMNSISRPAGPLWPQQRQRQQQLLNSPVNATPSPSSSPGVNLQIEPPSNQINIMSNFNTPFWREEERMVGMKRRWPFPIDDMSGRTSFKFEPDESPPMHGHDTFKFEPRSTNFRDDGPSDSVAFRVDRSCEEKNFEENGIPVDADFLTLGPSLAPSTSVDRPVCEFKQSMVAPPSHFLEHTEFSSVQHHGSEGDTNLGFGCSGQNSAQPPFYSFLPMGSSSKEIASNEQGGETSENVDLNLKL